MNYINAKVMKKDAMALVTGKPVYTDDIALKDALICKIIRSPHANAKITAIEFEEALEIEGVVGVFTYKDVPNKRFTLAGQTYPELSPYDRLLLDQQVRYVGDAVAIVAGESERCVKEAMKRIKVTYEKLTPVLDFRRAKDNPSLVHPESNWESLVPVGADNKRNLCASHAESNGDVNLIMKGCKYRVKETYHTKANQQAMMETFRTFTYLDPYGRLCVVSSTQIPFHVRRIVANALGIPKSQVRVIKPRIGGGFGAKQTAVTEMYPALVTQLTGRAAKIVYTREESQIASSPRHEMEVTVEVGADEKGIIKAIDVYTLSNTGAYGEHGPTTVGLSGHKPIPLYGKCEAYRFAFDVVYTNYMSAGAYRGYGATQGIFAVESAVNELAHKMNMDPLEIRRLNHVKENDIMPAYYGETATSCALDRCLERAAEMMDWKNKYPYYDVSETKRRSVGMAMAMQGSGISSVDVGSVEIKVNDDGFYTLLIGATDMGTGCDTILAQMVAECLMCSIDNVVVHGVDTDTSPYDSGSYASSTTYVTGNAVVKACQSLEEKIKARGADFLGVPVETVEFDGKSVYSDQSSISLKDIGNKVMCNNNEVLSASASHTSKTSPPPFMVGMVELETDLETGQSTVIDYVGVVDCGTVINQNLARVQTEGGLVQGIGMALFEDVTYTDSGKCTSNSLMQYKIPTRLDVGNIRVAFESSYEPSGPFGAKSIGEVVINTPCPAIADAVYNGTQVRVRTLPIKAEDVYLKREEQRRYK